MHTLRYRSATGHNHELRWHCWSVNLTSEQDNFFFFNYYFYPFSLQQEKNLHVSCFNCSHKLNLMRLPIDSSFPLWWSPLCTKSPILQLPPCRKVLLVFFWEIAFRRKRFRLQRDFLTALTRLNRLENDASIQTNARWAPVTFLFSFREFCSPLWSIT